jgi:hypothetical protein
MSRSAKIFVILGVLVAAAAIVVACTPSQAEVTTCPTCTECPTFECPTPAACPEATACPETVQAPFEALWAASGHADKEAAAFTHWDTEGEIPVTCAKCHSTPGFQDYVGADGSQPLVVDNPAPTGTVITCVACHNDATLQMTSVTFPSGLVLEGLGREAVCMTCHQGTASGASVDAAIAALGDNVDEDAVSTDLSFINVHYFAASIAKEGAWAAGGYQYAGMSYDAAFDHVEGYQTCTDCHDSHSLEVKVEDCAVCHTGVTTTEDLHNINIVPSPVDYDGNGTADPIYFELQGMQGLLLQAIQAYGTEVAGAAIGYTPDSHPYFFNDTNGDGTISEDEASRDNAYASWTPRLLKAAYNYQVSVKDPGAFAHGPNYIIELLYDSTASLNEKLSSPVDLSNAHRVAPGHFDGASEAFRHWDGEGEVSGSCTKCHDGAGLPQFLEQGVNTSLPVTNSLECTTCHENLTDFTRYLDESVTFPSGKSVSFDNLDANLCINCHQGRESGASVARRITSAETAANTAATDAGEAVVDYTDDTPVPKLGFINIHYFPAGVTLFGTEVQGAFEYPGQTYLGKFAHVPGMDNCTACHDTHVGNVKTEACAGCHGTDTPEDIRGASSTADYDGDGDTSEGMAGEVATMQEKLLAAIQAYATQVLDQPIAYDPSSHPYFFSDTNGDGVAQSDEPAYTGFSPRLEKAAYNYHYTIKEPGAYAHNGKYVLQVLYDSIADLATQVEVDMTGMVRP